MKCTKCKNLIPDRGATYDGTEKFCQCYSFCKASDAGQNAHVGQAKELSGWTRLRNVEYDRIAASVLGSFLDMPTHFVESLIQAQRMAVRERVEKEVREWKEE